MISFVAMTNAVLVGILHNNNYVTRQILYSNCSFLIIIIIIMMIIMYNIRKLMHYFEVNIKNVKVRKAAKTRNRYNQVPHLTQETTWKSDKSIIKHHKQEQRGQPFPTRQQVAEMKAFKTQDMIFLPLKRQLFKTVHKNAFHIGQVLNNYMG